MDDYYANELLQFYMKNESKRQIVKATGRKSCVSNKLETLISKQQKTESINLL